MLGEAAGVGIVTCSACPAFFVLIDVQEMKVYVPVAETGQAIGERNSDKLGFVALKAKSVLFFLKGSIELLGVSQPKEAETVPSVNLAVASRAIALDHRAVVVLLFLQESSNVLDGSIFVNEWFRVAIKAEVFFGLNQEMSEI